MLTPVQVNLFRAGHAHAGVLLLMSLLYYTFMDKTSLRSVLKHATCALLVVGILAQSGGFFTQMIPRLASVGISPHESVPVGAASRRESAYAP